MNMNVPAMIIIAFLTLFGFIFEDRLVELEDAACDKIKGIFRKEKK